MHARHDSIFQNRFKGWLQRFAAGCQAVLTLAVMSIAHTASGQCVPTWQENFPLPGVNGEVNAIVSDSDGNIYAGGSFEFAGTTLMANLAHFDPVTSTWNPLGVEYIDGDVNALALTPDGDLIVGGAFFSVDNIDYTARIARFSLATYEWSSIGQVELDGDVNSIVVLANGDIIIGGEFIYDNYTFTEWNHIARFDADDEEWGPMAQGVDGHVHALHVLQSGNVLVGGAFTNASDTPAEHLAVFNLQTEEWSEFAGGVNAPVHALKALNVTTVLVGGEFTAVGPTSLSAARIAGCNTNTQTWSAYGSGVNGTVRAISLYTGGDFVVGGEFSIAGGISRLNIARYRPANASWFSMATGVFGPVNAVHTLPSGDLIVGGEFTSAGSPQAGALNIARFVPATSTWSSLGSGINGFVFALTSLPDGNVVAGGSFVSAGSTAARFVGMYSPSLNTWSTLGTGMNGSVEALETLPDGDVIVGGQFTNAGGVPASRIARYRPSTNTWSAIGAGVGSRVRDIALISATEIVVVGNFTTAGGLPVINIAKCDLTTNTWTSLGDLTGGSVTSVGVLPNGDIIAGGLFTSAGGTPTNGIALRSAASGVWTSLSGPISQEVSVIKVVGPDEVLVGGRFTSIGGLPASRIGRYTPSTNTWSSLGSGVSGPLSSVTAISILLNGDFAIGGFFNNAGGVEAYGLARYIPATGTWQGMDTFFNSNVFALTTATNGDLFAGGPFTYGGPGISAYIAHAVFSGEPPLITSQPEMIDACPGTDAIFDVVATHEDALSYQWQIEQLPVESGVWIPLSDGPLPVEFSSGAVVSGATTAQLTLTLNSELGGVLTRYRARVSSECSSATSDPALLTSDNCAVCPADFNQDGGIDGSDVSDFFIAWENSEPPADTNLDGGIDGSDVEYFFQVWEAGGCP